MKQLPQHTLIELTERAIEITTGHGYEILEKWINLRYSSDFHIMLMVSVDTFCEDDFDDVYDKIGDLESEVQDELGLFISIGFCPVSEIEDLRRDLLVSDGYISLP